MVVVMMVVWFIVVVGVVVRPPLSKQNIYWYDEITLQIIVLQSNKNQFDLKIPLNAGKVQFLEPETKSELGVIFSRLALMRQLLSVPATPITPPPVDPAGLMTSDL